MIQVSRKDSKESLENLLRRFTRKVQQAGVITGAKQSQFFEKVIVVRRQSYAVSERI
jgi:ribosomal protein S21